jgi:hypothetical protein
MCSCKPTITQLKDSNLILKQENEQLKNALKLADLRINRLMDEKLSRPPASPKRFGRIEVNN